MVLTLRHLSEVSHSATESPKSAPGLMPSHAGTSVILAPADLLELRCDLDFIGITLLSTRRE